MQYLAKVRKEGRATLIEFPDCPGCQTFADQGQDVESIAREALEGWLEAHMIGSAAPPRPSGAPVPRKHIGVCVSPALAIAMQIRWRRQELGWSQADLGGHLAVSRQQAASLEDPDANLRLSTLEKAAAALQMHLSIEFTPTTVAKGRKSVHAWRSRG